MDTYFPTLVISRSRHQETADDTKTASFLAATFHTAVLDIPFLYDLPDDSSIVLRLRSLPQPVFFLVPLARRAVKCILNRLQIPYTGVFETKDAVQMPNGRENGGHVEQLSESPVPRWYPVIDDSKCTACLECVNFCLFGVYAIAADSRPLVDQPNACRDGCPACARVCPGNAIMFPLYEDRIIAGYEQPPADDLNNLIDLVDQI